jgi:DNA-binding NarL/FixJ family response regulator
MNANDDLTKREEEILSSLNEGFLNREIAFRWGIEPATVKKHLERIYDKLEVKNRTGAAVRGLLLNIQKQKKQRGSGRRGEN